MDIYRKLFKDYRKDFFVETGTHRGGSVERALEIGFKNIKSVEVFKEDFDYCLDRFHENKNVELYHGLSERCLSSMIKNIDEEILFFLDAHKNEWFEGGTHPLEEEIKIIGEHKIKSHNIIIDDCNHLGGFDHIRDLVKKYINSGYNFSYINQRNGILVAYF